MQLDLGRHAELVEHDGIIGGAFVRVEDEWETDYGASNRTGVVMLVMALERVMSYAQKFRGQDNHKLDSVFGA